MTKLIVNKDFKIFNLKHFLLSPLKTNSYTYLGIE